MDAFFPDPLSIPSLGIGEVAQSLELLMAANVPDEAKERFLVSLHTRGESASELAGFARVLLGRAVIPVLDRSGSRPLLELCGTGGDKAGLLNISTAAMFVTAGAGARVVKHGNRAFTSKCGSADVLEAMGVTVHLDPARVGEVLEEAGRIPSLSRNGRKVAWAVHGEGVHAGEGVDELSITGPSRVVAVRGECPMEPEEFIITPAGLGFPQVTDPGILLGGGAVENAMRITRILSGGETGGARDMIVLNAAAALHLAGIGATLRDALLLASEAIDAGRALRSLELLRSASARAGGVGNPRFPGTQAIPQDRSRPGISRRE